MDCIYLAPWLSDFCLGLADEHPQQKLRRKEKETEIISTLSGHGLTVTAFLNQMPQPLLGGRLQVPVTSPSS